MQVFGSTLFLLLQMTTVFSTIEKSPTKFFLKRTKRSVGHTCSQELVDNLAATAKKTCSNFALVDKYISNIKSRRQLSVPSFTDRHGFKTVLHQYNGDLKISQGHCHSWRNGSNVVDSIRQTILAAQGFEPMFNEEYVKNQARIKNVLKHYSDIAEMETVIAALQKDISQAKEALKVAKVQAVSLQLLNIIKTKEEKLNTTIIEYDIAKGRRELAELVKYLEFIKTGAIEIQTKANSANYKISTFRENILRDAGVFKRHRINAQDVIAKIQEEKQNNIDTINKNKENINDLGSKIKDEYSQIDSLNAKIAEAQRETRELEDTMNRSISKKKDTKKFGKALFFLSPFIGSIVYLKARSSERKLVKDKRKIISYSNRQISYLRDDIENRHQEVDYKQQLINSLETKNKGLEQELMQFSQLKGNFQSLEGEVNAILPSIASAFEAVGMIKQTFDITEKNLGNLVAQAKKAKTNAEIREMSYFIYNEIDGMKCKWEAAKNKIVLIGKCK